MRSNGRRRRGAGSDDMNRHLSGQASAGPSDAGDAVDIAAAMVERPVGRLLAAATAPASAGELLGEERAAAAFRSAAVMPAPSWIRDRRSRRVTGVVAVQAACALLVVAGGVALAAGTGVLPNPLVDVSTSQPAPPSAAPVSSRSTTGPSHGVSDSPPVDHPVPASVIGLCRAYEAHGGDSASMDSDAFGALVTAAGGADRVREFCVAVLADQPDTSGDEHAPPTTPPGQSAGRVGELGKP